jgi:alkaline phosphatase D
MFLTFDAHPEKTDESVSNQSMKKVKGKECCLRNSVIFPDWLSWMGVLFLSWGLGSCLPVVEVPTLATNGLERECAVGDVTPHKAMVWLKTHRPQKVKVQYTSDPLWTTYQETAWVQTLPERDSTVKISLANLTAHTQYWYRSLASGKPVGQPCRFRTAPLSEEAATVTFVVGGDTRRSFQPFFIMEAMRKEKPDFFIFLGDTIYADKGWPAQTLADYWEKYAENRDGYVKRLLAETSVYVIWDDHEVDSDFTAAHPLMPIGRQAFFDYWPISGKAQEPTRLYRAFRWGKAVELLILDTRQYRNPAAKTMLGLAQKHWLLAQLAASTSRFKFIISSVPFSDPRMDKWGEYPEERDEILGFIKKNGIPGVLFLTGDVHHAGVSGIPGFPDLKEYIFGPLAAPMNYRISSQEPRFEYFNDASRNFGKITVQPDESNPSARIEWLDERNRVLHRVMPLADQSTF